MGQAKTLHIVLDIITQGFLGHLFGLVPDGFTIVLTFSMPKPR